MDDSLIVVEGCVVTPADDTVLRRDVWAIALDQRAFGPGRLVVAFSDRSGRLLSVAHARRTDPPAAAFEACIQHLGLGSAAAVAFCDEPVTDGDVPESVAIGFMMSRLVAENYGIHLVDWISCDDTLMRSTRLSLEPEAEWWDVPPAPMIGRTRPRQVGRRGPPGEARWVPRNDVKRRR